MKTIWTWQIFPKGLAKISLGIPVDPILNFLERAAESFQKIYSF